MQPTGRHLRTLNWARAIAVSTLLVAAFAIEVLFVPERPLRNLYLLAAAVYGAILVYTFAERRLRSRVAAGTLQVVGDTVLAAGFVVATGGALSPVSFLFAVPVMFAAALGGARAAVASAGVSWGLYALVLLRDVVRLSPADLPLGRVLYAAVSHLLGFLLLGVLGGALADRLRAADRELAEQRGSLEALRAAYEQIVESINTGLLTTDHEGRVRFVNRAGGEILREGRPGLLGRPVTALFGLPADFLRVSEDTFRAGRRMRFERPWTAPGGDELLLGFAFAPLRAAEDGPHGWLVVFQDLTEIASLEAQVRMRERMAALGEMGAGMAHELRNPLAAISGCVQVLRDEVHGERRPLVDIALRETERLNRIIRDFLEFARPGEFRARSVDLLPLCEELSRLFRKSPDFKPAHRIEVRAVPGSTWAKADPDRVKQVFWNLAGNALKAMPDGGLLAVEVGGYGGEFVQLSFRDQGEGMDEETLARLFQPFHGRFREGCGLGAAIVYRIAEEHGGRVQVLSRPNRGTEIRVLLPAAAPEAPGGPARDPERVPTGVGAAGEATWA